MIIKDAKLKAMSANFLLCAAQPLRLLIACSLLAFSFSAEAAPAPGSKADQTKIRDMEREQATLLKDIKEQLARLPDDTEPRPDDSPEVTTRREQRAKLVALLREIEERIGREARRKPASSVIDQAYRAYFERFKTRVEQETANALAGHGVAPGESAILKVVIGSSGEIVELDLEQATTPLFARLVKELLGRMAPFEPLPASSRKRVNQAVISTKITYRTD